MSKLKPIGKRVLVEAIAVDKVTAGGILLTSKEDEKSNKGIVVSVSDEINNISVDDTIYFNRHTGAEIALGDKKYIMLKLEDIYAVVK